MKDIAIYIEGGGNTESTLQPFRTGMSAFLSPIVKVVRERRIRWRVIACGGRKEAFDAFVDAVRNEPNVFNVLLVDSEETIAANASPWTHLLNRAVDGWACPAGVDDSRCHLMVVCMEAWFLADPAGLQRHFGGRFDAGRLPPANQAETRSKAAISNALTQATRNAPAGEYKKIRDGAKLLAKVDPAVVRQHCTWCERLFRAFSTKLGVPI